MREIGIRMALGACAADVRRMVVADGLRLAGLGVAFGLAGALALARLVSTALYGVSPGDPLTLATVTAALLAAALTASFIPARRAARGEPTSLLRNE